jgi:hypothetical protein
LALRTFISFSWLKKNPMSVCVPSRDAYGGFKSNLNATADHERLARNPLCLCDLQLTTTSRSLTKRGAEQSLSTTKVPQICEA